MNTKTELKDWIPLIAQLIYPIIALIIIFIFKTEISDFYQKKVLSENSDVKLEVAGFALEIKQKAIDTKMKDLNFSTLGGRAISSAEYQPLNEQDANKFITKSTSYELRELMRENPTKSAFENLLLLSEKSFSIKLLRSYINQLGIKKIILIDNGKFAGLIDSHLFINQFSDENRIIRFENITSEVIGISKHSLNEKSSVLEVLSLMNEKNLSDLAILKENGELLYIAQRESLIAKLVTSIITEEPKNP